MSMLKPYYERQEILTILSRVTQPETEVNRIDDKIHFSALCFTSDTFNSEVHEKM